MKRRESLGLPCYAVHPHLPLPRHYTSPYPIQEWHNPQATMVVYCVVVWLWHVWQHFKSLYKVKQFSIFILYAILLWIRSVLDFRPTFHKGRIAYEWFRIALRNGIASTDISDCWMEGFICRSLIKNKIRPFSINMYKFKMV